jgi:hypothetical protein
VLYTTLVGGDQMPQPSRMGVGPVHSHPFFFFLFFFFNAFFAFFKNPKF